MNNIFSQNKFLTGMISSKKIREMFMTGHLYIGQGDSRVIFFRETPFGMSLLHDCLGVSIVSCLCLF